MRFAVCLIAGAALILFAVFDVAWTTLGTHGGGPLSGRFARIIWNGCLVIHRRHPNNRVLSFVGSALLLLTLILWLSFIWAGCLLIFSADPHSLVDTHTHRTSTLEDRVYVTGSVLFTLGTGEFTPTSMGWRIATVLTDAAGLGTVTLGIAFLLQVLTSVVLKRSLGAYISDLGGTPADILARAWTGKDFDGMELHVTNLTTMLHGVTEQHLAYPILHYFHSEKLRTSASVRIAALYETMFILTYVVAPEKRLGRMSILPVLDALAGFAEVIGDQFVEPAKEPPPAPDLEPLRSIGIPLVSPAECQRSLDSVRGIRCFLLGLVDEDGWSWADVIQKDGTPQRLAIERM